MNEQDGRGEGRDPCYPALFFTPALIYLFHENVSFQPREFLIIDIFADLFTKLDDIGIQSVFLEFA